MDRKHIGSTLDSLLEETGELAEVEARVAKRIHDAMQRRPDGKRYFQARAAVEEYTRWRIEEAQKRGKMQGRGLFFEQKEFAALLDSITDVTDNDGEMEDLKEHNPELHSVYTKILKAGGTIDQS